MRGALDLTVTHRQPIPGWVVAGDIALLFFGIVGYAQLSNHWQTAIPAATYFEIIPNANSFGHPGY